MCWITSSRRSCSKSTSMSGGSSRSADMKREKSSVLHRIDRGDAEQEADDRIGRRPASLAEYGRILCFGETDEIVNGQEIVGIAPAPDQPQLVPHQLANLGRQRRFITRFRRRLHQMVKIVERFPAWRHRFVRIFVAQIVEAEADAREQLRAFAEIGSANV